MSSMNFDYFLPVLTEDTFSILQGTIYIAIYSTAPFFLLWNEKTEKNLLKPYLLSSLTVFINVKTSAWTFATAFKSSAAPYRRRKANSPSSSTSATPATRPATRWTARPKG